MLKARVRLLNNLSSLSHGKLLLRLPKCQLKCVATLARAISTLQSFSDSFKTYRDPWDWLRLELSPCSVDVFSKESLLVRTPLKFIRIIKLLKCSQIWCQDSSRFVRLCHDWVRLSQYPLQDSCLYQELLKLRDNSFRRCQDFSYSFRPCYESPAIDSSKQINEALQDSFKLIKTGLELIHIQESTPYKSFQILIDKCIRNKIFWPEWVLPYLTSLLEIPLYFKYHGRQYKSDRSRDGAEAHSPSSLWICYYVDDHFQSKKVWLRLCQNSSRPWTFLRFIMIDQDMTDSKTVGGFMIVTFTYRGFWMSSTNLTIRPPTRGAHSNDQKIEHPPPGWKYRDWCFFRVSNSQLYNHETLESSGKSLELCYVPCISLFLSSTTSVARSTEITDTTFLHSPPCRCTYSLQVNSARWDRRRRQLRIYRMNPSTHAKKVSSKTISHPSVLPSTLSFSPHSSHDFKMADWFTYFVRAAAERCISSLLQPERRLEKSIKALGAH